MARPESPTFDSNVGAISCTGIPFLPRLGRFLLVLLIAPALLVPRQESSSILVRAFPNYIERLPNGNNVRGPSGESWSGVGHFRAGGGGELNQFGLDFAAAGHTWTTELCQMDSDCDGFTNGQELGDPNCEWSEGDIPTFDVGITHPGIADRISDQQRKRTRRNRKLEESCADYSAPSNSKKRSFLLPSYDVPRDDTTYVKMSFELDFNNGDELAVRFTPIIQNPEVVHHILIYQCDRQVFGFSTPSTSRRMPCSDLVYAWAVGGRDFCLPEGIGMELESSKPWFLMEVHFDNPKGLRNIVDSSGIDVTTIVASASPDYERAGWLQSSVNPLAFFIPPGRDSFEIKADCNYPLIPEEGINVFSTMPHAHELGRKIWTEVQRPVVGRRNRNLDSSLNCPSYCSERLGGRCDRCFDNTCCSTQDPDRCVLGGKVCCNLCVACDGCEGCYKHDEQCNPNGYADDSEVEVEQFDLGCDTRYDFDLQELVPLFEQQKVYSTDKLVTHCVYDSTERDEITLSGDETENEMCIGYFLYYPVVRSDTMRCLSKDLTLDAGPGEHTCNMPGQPESFFEDVIDDVECSERVDVDGDVDGEVDGGGSTSSSSAGKSDLPLWLWIHIVCVMAGMGVLMPTGVVMAISFRSAGSGSEWFQYHKILTSSGLFLLVVGCCAAFWGIKGTHWMDIHHKLGLAVLILALVQPLNAYFRPKPNTNNEDIETAGVSETQKKSCTMPNARTLWEIWHKSSGRLTVVGAWTNTFLGISLVQEWYGASGTTSAALMFLQVVSIALLLGVVVYRGLFHRPSPPVVVPASTPQYNNTSNTTKNRKTKKRSPADDAATRNENYASKNRKTKKRSPSDDAATRNENNASKNRKTKTRSSSDAATRNENNASKNRKTKKRSPSDAATRNENNASKNRKTKTRSSSDAATRNEKNASKNRKTKKRSPADDAATRNENYASKNRKTKKRSPSDDAATRNENNASKNRKTKTRSSSDAATRNENNASKNRKTKKRSPSDAATRNENNASKNRKTKTRSSSDAATRNEKNASKNRKTKKRSPADAATRNENNASKNRKTKTRSSSDAAYYR